MKLIDNIENGLFLDTSKIPGAGIGLFTSKAIPPGVPVCEYKGDIFDTEEKLKKLNQRYDYTLCDGAKTRHTVYVVNWSNEEGTKWVSVDSHPSLCESEIGMGTFANDALDWESRQGKPKEEGRVDIKWRTKAGYNVYFWHFPREPKFFLMSFAQIEAGQEILLDYGDPYWECVGKIRPEEQKAAKEKK